MRNTRGGRAREFQRLLCVALTCTLVVGLAPPASAGKSWFTAVTADGWTTPVSAISPSAPFLAKQDTTTYIDLTVSLYKKDGDPEYPRGDDDGSTQGDAASAEQDAYERIFQFMADAIYEMSEGKQKLRNVRIFTQGKRAADADVVWTNKGGPKATVSGISGSGGHIWMYDIFENGSRQPDGTLTDFDLLADPEGAGYTLAHEMGHYWFGVYDEYQIATDDVPVDKAIMNSQWQARGAKPAAYDWLNFSVAYDAANPTGPWVNTKKTAQHRKYEESCWETISRNPTSDPKTGDLNATFSRKYYAEVAGAAPAAGGTPTRDLSGSKATTADARSNLNVIWVTGDLVYQIVLDRSGSMYGSPLEDAKTAAKFLVDLAEVGSSSIGVVIFDSGVSVLTPITPVTDDAVKAAIKAQIDTISSGGATAIGDGAQVALNGLLALGTTNDVKTVFLLSDGYSNSGVSPLSVIPAYQTAQVPIFAFAYGTGADTFTLGEMATQTGGELFISPTTLAAVTTAFQKANDSAGGSESVAAESDTAPVGFTTVAPIQVDSTVGRIAVSVVHDGAPEDATVRLVAPGGGEVAPVSTSQSTGQTLLAFVVEMPALGEWRLQITPASADIGFSYQATASSEGIQFALNVEATGGVSSVAYPQPFLVVAALERELPIIAATVAATVTKPDDQTIELVLRDDGAAPDAAANDGRYSGLLLYDMNGVYDIEVKADNFTTTAQLYAGNAAVTGRTDGTQPSLGDPVDIDEPFERRSSVQVTVSGVMADDHGNDAQSATIVLADNSDTPGQIELADDVDFFEFVAPEDAAALVGRVSGLAGGLSPLLTIYSGDGASVLGQGTLEDAASQNGYVYVSVPVTAGETYFASVERAEAKQDGGLYQFSVGPGTAFDRAEAPVEPTPDRCGCNPDGGKARDVFLGDLTILAAAALLLIGANARRRRR